MCHEFDDPRRTAHYKTTKKPLVVQEPFARPTKQMIEENPSFGYRTVAYLLKFNKNTVQRVLQLIHWQALKRPVGFRPRVRALPSAASALNEYWAAGLCRVWSGRDDWAVLALVDRCTRELLEWHLSRSTQSRTANAALEQNADARLGTLRRAPTPSILVPSVDPPNYANRPVKTKMESDVIRVT